MRNLKRDGEVNRSHWWAESGSLAVWQSSLCSVAGVVGCCSPALSNPQTLVQHGHTPPVLLTQATLAGSLAVTSLASWLIFPGPQRQAPEGQRGRGAGGAARGAAKESPISENASNASTRQCRHALADWLTDWLTGRLVCK